MRKRIIPLLAALCLLLCLLPSAALAAETDGTVDQSRSYNFVLTAEKGQTEVKATAGEVITVSLVLKRTDSARKAPICTVCRPRSSTTTPSSSWWTAAS